MRKYAKFFGGVALLSALPSLALAQDAPTLESLAANDAFVFNTLLFLIGGFLVMWMAAGFAMLEAGFVRTKNVSMQCLKNISLYSVAGLMFWVVGYQLMYGGGDYFGKFAIMSFTPEDAATGYSSYSDWFFQMVFCATTASIVSGTVAERIKFWPFIIFTLLLTGFIYPIVGSWEWGGGFLDAKFGFSDFAGSTLVHSTGGWAALIGAIILGARKGKYVDGKVNPIPGSNMTLATLGVFILWLGWFGFNGASQLAMGTISDADAIAKVFVNTNMAAAAGVIVAVIYCQVRYGKIDLTLALNGALAGLVAITAEPLAPAVWQSLIIGGIGSLLACLTVPLLDKLKIDDVVGAIPVHLVAGIFGTMIVPWTGDATYFGQFVGVISVGIFVSLVSAIIWTVLKLSIGLRVSEEDEHVGLDQAEIGVPSYPEFVAN
ncbi:ammonium transporter [Litorimonas taeanensis]|uniref:Ammonium transporter n=1 Tax=Litorimonas taeanensis TaxID=568099 RepID=A0A420WFR6_9PROT|nr:ammonium transporter [Litorimonas taeanensis]RKQ69812.1 ammonium transporter [Litorimonas taeanensis]